MSASSNEHIDNLNIYTNNLIQKGQGLLKNPALFISRPNIEKNPRNQIRILVCLKYNKNYFFI